MGKQSKAKKKRREKRLGLRKREEKANQNLAILSEGFQKITNKLKETDKEFAQAHAIFDSLKDKYLFEDEDENWNDIDNFSSDEKERFNEAFQIVMKKQIGVMEDIITKSL